MELDRLQQIEVTTTINQSEWAALIVYAKKQNGNLTVCADLSTGLYKALQSFDYTLPVPEDVFAFLTERRKGRPERL